jgi:hypothetical protein
VHVTLLFGSDGVSVPFGPTKISWFIFGSLSEYHFINTLSLFNNGKFNANVEPLFLLDRFLSMCIRLHSAGCSVKYNIDWIGTDNPNMACICSTVEVLHGTTLVSEMSKILSKVLASYVRGTAI